MYNIADCARDLAATSYEIERNKTPNKHFRVYNKVCNKIELSLNKRGAMQAIAEKLSHRAGGTQPQSIDLNYYAYSHRDRVVPYNDISEIMCEELTEQESESLNKSLEWLMSFSQAQSRAFWYMVEWGNGHTAQTAAAYNFYAYIAHEGHFPQDMPPFAPSWILAAFPYQSDEVRRDMEREKDDTNRRREYFQAFKTIFEHCLYFNIDLGIGNEKPQGINEQTALEFIDSLGSYNAFNLDKFERLVHYCNQYFICEYGEGNCNTGKKNYSLKFGREGSVVVYLETFFKSEDELRATLDELSELIAPDEIWATRQIDKCNTYNDMLWAAVRMWWD